MASEKCAKQTPAVLDFNTQTTTTAGARGHPNAKTMLRPPHREWNAPRPTENETHTLAPDINRGYTAGMDRVDVNAHLDDTGISHGTKQGLMRAHGMIVEPAKLVWKLQGKATNSPWSSQPKEIDEEFTKIPN